MQFTEEEKEILREFRKLLRGNKEGDSSVLLESAKSVLDKGGQQLKHKLQTQKAFDYYFSPLHAAARHGPVCVLQWIITHIQTDTHITEDGAHPLYRSILGGQLACFQLLLESGAQTLDIFLGASAMHWAACWNRRSMVEVLINKRPQENHTLLMQQEM